MGLSKTRRSFVSCSRLVRTEAAKRDIQVGGEDSLLLLGTQLLEGLEALGRGEGRLSEHRIDVSIYRAELIDTLSDSRGPVLAVDLTRVFGEFSLSDLSIERGEVVLVVVGSEGLVRSGQGVISTRGARGFDSLPQPFVEVPELATQVTTTLDSAVDRRRQQSA